MKNNFIKESLIAVVLIVLLVLLINPMHFWMPDMAHESMVIGLILVFGLYSVFVLREKAGDEREVLHRMFAARAAFFVGTLLMTVGIFLGAQNDAVDIWLVIALVAMILTKIIARFYSDRNL